MRSKTRGAVQLGKTKCRGRRAMGLLYDFVIACHIRLHLVRRALKADTLAEAERMRDAILSNFKRHTTRTERTFADALTEYEESLRARGVQSAPMNAEIRPHRARSG